MGGNNCNSLSLSSKGSTRCAWDMHFDSGSRASVNPGGPSEYGPPQAPGGWWSAFTGEDSREKLVSSWNAAASNRCIQTRFGELCAGAFPLVPTRSSERAGDHSNSVVVVGRELPEKELGIRAINAPDGGAMFLGDPYRRPMRLNEDSLEMGAGIVLRVPLRWPF